MEEGRDRESPQTAGAAAREEHRGEPAPPRGLSPRPLLSQAARKLLLPAGALAAYALLVLHFDFLADDAYISFRYARNLAEGQGLAFNPGEHPPVEGYSNLLWVLWLALFERAGVDVTLAARVSSIACGAGLLAVFVRLCARARIPPAASVCGLWLLATFPPLAVWSTGGLETVPFTLACFALFVLLGGRTTFERALAAGAVGAAAALLRADGVLWVAVVFAVAALGERERRAEWARWALTAVALVAAAAVAQLAWRVGYHGEWLPNTVRIKGGASLLRLERGARYLASHGLELPALVLVPLLALLAQAWKRRPLALQAGLVVLFAAGHAVWVGGDFMAMGRFLVPAAPFLALLWAASAERVLALRRGSPAVWSATAGLVALALLASFDRMPVPAALRQALHFRWSDPRALSEAAMWRAMAERSREWAWTGRALASLERPGESLVIANIGAIGYYTRLTLHDPLGLVSPVAARSAGRPVRASAGHDKRVSPEFFLPLRPTFLGAWLEPAEAPAEERAVEGALLRLERHPLPSGEGFPPGLELRLLRFQWAH